MSDFSGDNPNNSVVVPQQYSDPFWSVKSDGSVESSFINNTGIRFFHYVAVQDPLYKVRSGDLRHSFDQEENAQFADDDRFQRENGFIYFKAGIVFGIFSNGTKDLKYLKAGLYTDAGATMSINRYYLDTNQHIQISENDKLIPCELPKEFYTTITHSVDHNPTGIDRLQFKSYLVTHFIDADGKIYIQDVDFNVVNGYIKWINGRPRPGLDPISSRGMVCGVRYTYKPFYYIKLVLHDIRIKPVINTNTNEITTKAGPILVQVQADWVYLNNRTSSENAVDAQLIAPDGGNDGVR
jgi:hypothetical protein